MVRNRCSEKQSQSAVLVVGNIKSQVIMKLRTVCTVTRWFWPLVTGCGVAPLSSIGCVKLVE
jgi:hypothetical protein